MDTPDVQPTLGEVLALAAEQHGLVTRAQLRGLGLHPEAIRHRMRTGRLHTVRHGVYAVGRPQLSRHGVLMAAVLACGRGAVASHESAAGVWGLRPWPSRLIEVSVPACRRPRAHGVVVHRRGALGPGEVSRRREIRSLPRRRCVDLATRLERGELEAAVNQADKLDLIDPEELRGALGGFARQPGSRRCARLSTGARPR
jgi:hypothetical protein